MIITFLFMHGAIQQLGGEKLWSDDGQYFHVWVIRQTMNPMLFTVSTLLRLFR